MAIRIVEEKPDPSVLKRVICRNCGVKLEYVPLDVKSKRVQSFDETETIHWIECPKCQNHVSVKA
jgi:Zn finger protein HypA/HybF involved in hydrogenase expression